MPDDLLELTAPLITGPASVMAPGAAAFTGVSSPMALPVVGAKPGTKVQVIPGQLTVALEPAQIQPLAICELVPANGGVWRAVARICPRHFSITPRNLQKLGIVISSRGLRRLIVGGFVAGGMVTPGLYQFDYADYLRHEAAVAADLEFWDRIQPPHTFSNRERYRQALI